MKTLILVFGILTASVAYACTTQTVMTPNGAQTCTTCCAAGGNCTTTCF